MSFWTSSEKKAFEELEQAFISPKIHKWVLIANILREIFIHIITFWKLENSFFLYSLLCLHFTDTVLIYYGLIGIIVSS